MTLTDFLLARIDEDEAAAKSADGVCPAPWGRSEPPTSSACGHLEDAVGTAVAVTAPVFQAHIARHDPARVLAECEAKRRIVERYTESDRDANSYDSDNPNQPMSYWTDWADRHAWHEAVQILAAVYADHPDHREEWKP
jgi:hypothetical protein